MLQTSNCFTQKWVWKDQSYNIHFSFELISNPFQPKSPEIDIPSVRGVGVQTIDSLPFWNGVKFEREKHILVTEACFSHTSESSGDLRIHEDDMTRLAPTVKQLSKSAF